MAGIEGLVSPNGEPTKKKEEFSLKIFFRTMPGLAIHTPASRDEILAAFYTEAGVEIPRPFIGLDELGNPIEHFFDFNNTHEVACLVITPLQDRKIVEVHGHLAPPPGAPRRH